MSRQTTLSPSAERATTALSAAITQDRDELMTSLAERRKQMGVSQTALAEKLGLSRMSVARAERLGTDLQLSTFLGMAKGLGMEVRLKPPKEQKVGADKKSAHKGLAHNRIATEDLRKRNPLEAQFSKSWMAANDHSPQLPGVLHQLVPGFHARDAEVAATVVQWLGSEVGFAFLRQALAEAGYAVTEPRKNRA